MKNFEQPVMRCVHKRAAFTFGQPLSFVLGSTVICLLTGRACLLLHRQNSIVPLLTTSISRHPLPTDTQPVHRRFIHASPV